MQPEENSFRVRMRKGVLVARRVTTPVFMVRTLVNNAAVLGSALIALKITGLEPFVDTFFDAHRLQMYKAVLFGSLVYPIIALLGDFLFAFLKGLFDWREEMATTQT